MKLDDKQGMAIPESSEFSIDEIHSSSSLDSSFFPWDSSFWGTNPKDKLKNIELIGIAALGLLLLSLFSHFYYARSIFVQWGGYDESYPLTCYIQQVFIFGGTYTFMDFATESCYWGYYEIAPSPFTVSNILLYPLLPGLFLFFLYCNNNYLPKQSPDFENILRIVLIALIVKHLIVLLYELSYILGYFDYLVQLFFIIFELICLISLLFFTFHSSGLIKINSSKEIIILMSVFTFAYLSTIFYVLISDDYMGYWFWDFEFFSYILYVLLSIISLPLFLYSLCCFFAYKVNFQSSTVDITPSLIQNAERKPPKQNVSSEVLVMKLKEAQELLKQGVITEDEFKKIKEEYL